MTIVLPESAANGPHAVVVGGSIAGCLAAEVLSQSFPRVTIIEKGDFTEQPQPRRAVPQENHVHLLLLRGKQAMGSIFPGLLEELEEAGAVVADLGHDIKWYQQGHWKERFPTGIHAHYSSRALLDSKIRSHILKNGRITVRADSRALGVELAACASGRSLAAVHVESQGQRERLAARLVVDASGRGSRASEWLREAGCGEVEQSLVATRLGYASRIYRRRPEYADRWKVLLVLPSPPVERRMGVISPIEGDRWLVTTGGWFGDFPRPQADEFVEFLKGLPVPDIHEVVRDAEPLSDVFGHNIPGSLWRHYEDLQSLPDGFLVIGDATCSFNPLYSQGMTICALEAEALRSRIPKWLDGAIATRDIQRVFASILRPAWEMANCEDLRFPETNGVRNAALRWRHWIGAQVARQSAWHRLTLQTQVGVSNLVTPPSELYRPQILLRLPYTRLRWNKPVNHGMSV